MRLYQGDPSKPRQCGESGHWIVKSFEDAVRHRLFHFLVVMQVSVKRGWESRFVSGVPSDLEMLHVASTNGADVGNQFAACMHAALWAVGKHFTKFHYYWVFFLCVWTGLCWPTTTLYPGWRTTQPPTIAAPVFLCTKQSWCRCTMPCRPTSDSSQSCPHLSYFPCSRAGLCWQHEAPVSRGTLTQHNSWSMAGCWHLRTDGRRDADPGLKQLVHSDPSRQWPLSASS